MGLDNAVRPLQETCEEESPAAVEVGFQGPAGPRECRDVVFLVLFAVFVIGMGLVSWRGITNGNPYRLIYGTDSYGNTCNQDNGVIEGLVSSRTGLDLRSRPFLYYLNGNLFSAVIDSAKQDVASIKICVSKCPSTTIRTVAEMQNFTNESGSQLCVYNIPPSAYYDGASSTTTSLAECPTLPIQPHEDFLYRCVPSAVTKRIDHVLTAINSFLDAIEENLVEKGASDIKNSWFEMCLLCAFAIVVSVILSLLLQFVTWFIVWFMVIAMVIGTLVATGVCWYHYYDLRTHNEATPEVERTTQMDKKVQDWLIGSVCVTAITIIVLLILLAVRKHIKLVVELFRQAGAAVRCMPLLLIHPLITVVFLLGFFIPVVWIFIYVETAGSPELDKTTGTVRHKTDSVLNILKWYYIFGIVWILQVVLACHKMTVAGAVSLWYFTRDKQTLSFPILRSVWNILRYHFGSIVFGSLIITFVIVIRMVLSFIENRLRERTHPIAIFLLKCLKCCLWCFEKFIKFLNNNAYIEIAIHGYGFCKAAREAFSIILVNAIKLAAINSVGDFVLFLGKVATVAVVTVVGIEYISMRKNIYFVWLPVSLTGIFAYFISSCFMSVYEMTIDTIFVCFCEDSKENNGKDKPYFMSSGLMKCLSERLTREQPSPTPLSQEVKTNS